MRIDYDMTYEIEKSDRPSDHGLLVLEMLSQLKIIRIIFQGGAKSAGLRGKRSSFYGRTATPRRTGGLTRAYSTETSLSLPILASPTKQAREPPVDLDIVLRLEDEIETEHV